MCVITEKNLNFLVFVCRKCLKAISLVKKKRKPKLFQRKNINFLKLFLNIYNGLGYFILVIYQFNSQNMRDKRNATRDSRFLG